MRRADRSEPRDQAAALATPRVPTTVLLAVAAVLSLLATLALGVDGPAADGPVAPTAPASAGLEADPAIEDDPALTDRIADDVVASINAERRAHGLPPLDAWEDRTVVVEHNEAQVRQEARSSLTPTELAQRYDGRPDRVRELQLRLGTGTRSGEAVAGWLADPPGRSALLHRHASAVAVAVTCDPTDRGGDLVLTVHVLDTDRPPSGDGPVGTERPGAGRGEACQFAALATGPNPEEGVVVPAALTAAATVAMAFATLLLLRRRTLARRRVTTREQDRHVSLPPRRFRSSEDRWPPPR